MQRFGLIFALSHQFCSDPNFKFKVSKWKVQTSRANYGRRSFHVQDLGRVQLWSSSGTSGMYVEKGTSQDTPQHQTRNPLFRIHWYLKALKQHAEIETCISGLLALSKNQTNSSCVIWAKDSFLLALLEGCLRKKWVHLSKILNFPTSKIAKHHSEWLLLVRDIILLTSKNSWCKSPPLPHPPKSRGGISCHCIRHCREIHCNWQKLWDGLGKAAFESFHIRFFKLCWLILGTSLTSQITWPEICQKQHTSSFKSYRKRQHNLDQLSKG